MSEKGEIVTFEEPNKYARRAKIELHGGDSVVFRGYQEFVLTRDTLRVLEDDQSLRKKQGILAPYFVPKYLKCRTVLDLGANSGFFCFWALQKDADKAIAVDMDQDYLAMMETARSKLEFVNLEIVKANVRDWNQPSDVVLALALVHWIYSCTAFFGSLRSAVKKLSELTKYVLFVEWVDPEDPAMKFFHHNNWNKDFISGPYSHEAFESALSEFFESYKLIGKICPTRRLYVAFRTRHEIDLSGPLPLIMPKDSVVDSRCIVKIQGTEYWSRVYDGGDVIYKQGTLDLALREVYFLSELKSNYFPRVLEVKLEEDYSVITLEKIWGVPIKKASEEIRLSPVRLHAFIQDCLCLLEKLRERGIAHRDIRPENILVRAGRPVLIDFGWAISDAHPYFTPELLGASGRPPDRKFCEIYSMGKVLELLNQGGCATFDPAIELMTEPDSSLRITDLVALKILFSIALANVNQHLSSVEEWEVELRNELSKDLKEHNRVVRNLLDGILERNRRLKVLKALQQHMQDLRLSLLRKETQVADFQAAAQANSKALAEIQNSLAWQLIVRYRRTRDRIFVDGTRRKSMYLSVVNGVGILINQGGRSFFSTVMGKIKRWVSLRHSF